jgi:hypothetical protein
MKIKHVEKTIRLVDKSVKLLQAITLRYCNEMEQASRVQHKFTSLVPSTLTFIYSWKEILNRILTCSLR